MSLACRVLPITAVATSDLGKAVNDFDRPDVLGHLVPELLLDAQAQRRTVGDSNFSVLCDTTMIAAKGLGWRRAISVTQLVAHGSQGNARVLLVEYFHGWLPPAENVCPCASTAPATNAEVPTNCGRVRPGICCCIDLRSTAVRSMSH